MKKNAPARQENPRRKRRKRGGRRRNPSQSNPGVLSKLDGEAALALGVLGAIVGGISALAATSRDTTAGKFSLAAAAGGAMGAVLGAVLPKGRSSNPLKNPIGAGTALVAGTVLVLAPAAVIANERHAKMARSSAPSVRGKYGDRKLDVFRSGAGWGWRSGEMAGGEETRRESLEIVLGELGAIVPADSTLVLDFYPEAVQLTVYPLANGQWAWRTSTTGEGGDVASRVLAIEEGLSWIDAHSEYR